MADALSRQHRHSSQVFMICLPPYEHPPPTSCELTLFHKRPCSAEQTTLKSTDKTVHCSKNKSLLPIDVCNTTFKFVLWYTVVCISVFVRRSTGRRPTATCFVYSALLPFTSKTLRALPTPEARTTGGVRSLFFLYSVLSSLMRDSPRV